MTHFFTNAFSYEKAFCMGRNLKAYMRLEFNLYKFSILDFVRGILLSFQRNTEGFTSILTFYFTGNFTPNLHSAVLLTFTYYSNSILIHYLYLLLHRQKHGL